MKILTRIPPNIRLAIYLIYSITSAVLSYLVTKKIVGPDELALWLTIGSAVGLTAGANVPPPD